MNQSKRYVMWPEYLAALDNLVRKMRSYRGSQWSTIRTVYGIPRGGLIPAVRFAYAFNLDLMLCHNGSELNTWYTKRCLIVDDIVDTGKTLACYQEAGFIIASVFWRKGSAWIPNFYGQAIEHSDYLVFPYEEPITL